MRNVLCLGFILLAAVVSVSSAPFTSKLQAPHRAAKASAGPRYVPKRALVRELVHAEVVDGLVPDPAVAATERPRGGEWPRVYRSAAPSVLFLATGSGHGSGFLVDKGGWILTNHHVASTGTLDGERHWHVNVYHGQLGDDGSMRPVDVPVSATVFKWDPDRDLALLRLDDHGAGLDASSRPLSLAASERCVAGSGVALIGNAGAGFLWSMKTGEISSVGTVRENTPDLISRIDREFRTTATRITEEALHRLQGEIASNFGDWSADTQLIQTTAEATPGDSGGPLLDTRGDVAGICKGGMGLNIPIPREYRNEGGREYVNVPLTYYYVHRNEIAKFLATKPRKPLLEIARSFWDSSALAYDLRDITDDGAEDLLVGVDRQSQLTMAAADLDGTSGVEDLRVLTSVDVPIVGVHAFRSGSEPMVTVYSDGTIVGSDTAGAVVWHLASPGEVTCSALSPDGRLGAVGFRNGSVLLFDPQSGKTHARGKFFESAARAVAFEPGSACLWAAAASDRTLRRACPGGGTPSTLVAPGEVLTIDVSPLGDRVVASSAEGGLWMLDAGDGRVLWSRDDLNTFSIRFDPSGRFVAASLRSDDHTLYWLSSETGDTVRSTALDGSPYAFAFSSDGREVCVALHEAGTYVLHRSEDGAMIAKWTLPRGEGEGLARLFLDSETPPIPIGSFAVLEDQILTGDGATVHGLDRVEPGQVRSFRHSIEQVDVARCVEERCFDAEFALVIDYNLATSYALYDLDGNGSFEIVRVDADGNGKLDSSYRREGDDYSRQPDAEPSELVLRPENLPEAWRERYATLVEELGL